MEKDNYLKSFWNTAARRPQKIYQITIDVKAVLDYTIESLQSICRSFEMKTKKKGRNYKFEYGCDSGILETKN
jgi:DNA-binding PadR family transcriptional regulator